MSTSWSVALAGFNPAERSTLENLLQMAGKQGPTFALAFDLSMAKCIIANADDAVVMRKLRAMHPAPRVLLIGASAGDSGWPIQGRPIKLLSVLDALRRMADQAATAAAPAQFDSTQSFMAPGAGASPSQAAPPPDFDKTQPFMAPRPASAPPDFEKTQPFMAGSTPTGAGSPSQFAKTQTFSIDELRAATAGRAPAPAPVDEQEFAKTVAFPKPASGAGTDFAKTVAFQAMPEGAAPPQSARAAPTPMAERGHEQIDEAAMARWRQAHRPPGPPSAAPAPTALPEPEEVGVGAGSGSAFLGTLPLQVGPGGAVDHMVVAPTPPKPLGDVLVVDDGDVARAATQRMLNRNGFHADVATSGQQAVELAKTRAYKYMFIDEISGGMNALQACRAVLQARGAGTRPRMVIMSSRGGMIDKLKAKLAGCDAYLVKPVKEDDLLRVIDDRKT